MADPGIYTVGWICAVSTEFTAAKLFLDEEHTELPQVSIRDTNSYALGRISSHNVVIAVLPEWEYGLVSATGVAINMLSSFSNVRFGLLVGIGGGVPSARHDIRLGDVVVSATRGMEGGVFQYDFGETLQGQCFRTTGFLNQPPTLLRTAMHSLMSYYEMEGVGIGDTINSLLSNRPRLRRKYSRPAREMDRLYLPDVLHPRDDNRSCNMACGENTTNQTVLVERRERADDEDDPAIHYGTIASANQLMRDAHIRDKLASEKDVLCFEMEAAGLMNQFPCLVIRGICDYSDTHKNMEWQGYAAMVAAAYAKDLLCRISPNQVKAQERITLSDIKNSVASIREDTQTLVSQTRAQEDLDVLEWLTSDDYGPQQSDYFRRRQEGTCQWFFKSSEFQSWVVNPSETIFCPGIPGGGKTILTSMVVEWLELRFEDDQHTGIAYIYCNFRRQDVQTLNDLLASMVKQLAQSQRSFPAKLKDAYRRHSIKKTRPMLKELLELLRYTAAAFKRTFIIIDALDECTVHSGNRDRLLSTLFQLQKEVGVNLFMTSRYIPEIIERFTGSTKLDIRADDGDIRRYIEDHIYQLPAFVKNASDLKDEIATKIIKAVDGMFLLAQLHFNSLEGRKSIKAVRTILSNLATGNGAYDRAYTDAMQRINGQGGDRREVAVQTLTWISCARRPLTTIELQHALAVELGERELDITNMSESDYLVSACAGLVVVDEESKIVRLVHFTTQEYLVQTRHEWSPAAETEMTQVFATYLSFKNFDSGNCPNMRTLMERFKDNPLYHYAATHWGYHAKKAMDPDRIFNYLKRRRNVEAANQVLLLRDPERPRTQFLKDPEAYKGRPVDEVPTGVTGLHQAAYFGIESVIGYFCGTDLNAKDSFGQTALWNASEQGQHAVVRLLIQEGADVEAKDRNSRTPLFKACERGHETVVQLLLDATADADAKDKFNTTPFWKAVDAGHEGVVRLLLEHGVCIDARDQFGRTPLAAATKSGNIDIMRLLIDKGADLKTKDEHNRTLLWVAASQDNDTVMQLLIDRGADIETRDNENENPLLVAVQRGNEAAVRLLLTKNANIEVRDAQESTLLMHAVENGSLSVVQLLLEQGADVAAKNKRNQTALERACTKWVCTKSERGIVQLLLKKGADIGTEGETVIWWAVAEGDEDTLRLLIDMGVNVNQKPQAQGVGLDENAPSFWFSDGYEPSPPQDYASQKTLLQLAAEKGHETIVQLLLAEGADIDEPDLQCTTPLMEAARGGHRLTFQLLLDKGANFKAQNAAGLTLLHMAADGGDEDIVRFLLNHHAHIEAKTRDGTTPLHLAVQNDHAAITTLLIDRGAEINATDDEGLTPLHLAARNRCATILKLLLDAGANLEVKSKSGRTPLSTATAFIKIYEPLVTLRLLLEKGANINAVGNYGTAPLQIAVERGHEDIVRLLLKWGANIETRDNEGRTPLRTAVMYYHEAILQLLLDNGADIDAKDNNGYSPLEYAVLRKRTSIAQVMIKKNVL